MSLYGGIEAGGTKFVCVVASGPEDIRAETRFPTTTPEETLEKVITFFQREMASANEALKGIGIACFGPVDLNHKSPSYGYITSTPKQHWQNVDIVGLVSRALNLPVTLDTDVNAAAVGEGVWGAGKGLENFVYLTIGTGIGGGAVVNGRPVHGLVHPEMGHMRIPHDWKEDAYDGCCPYHGDCWEGLAAGPAIKLRWGQSAEMLPADHPAWDLEAKYLGMALTNIVLMLSPQRIILGGGVMQQPHLFPLVRAKTQIYLNQYIQSPVILNEIDQFIVPPGLGNRAGVMGAVALAQQME